MSSSVEVAAAAVVRLDQHSKAAAIVGLVSSEEGEGKMVKVVVWKVSDEVEE